MIAETLKTILFSFTVIAVMLCLVILFDNWRYKDHLKEQQKANKEEVDRLLELDEFEQKIS